MVWGLLALLLLPSSGFASPALGAVLDPPPFSADAREAELDRLIAGGVHTVRFALDWNRVEPQPGQFTWQVYDALVDAALARGIEVVLVLGPCAEWAVDPAWEVPADQRSRSIPRSTALWERYVRGALSHFQGRVQYWQVREQPTSKNFRGARSEYLRLLAAAAEQGRSLDPDSRIVVPEPGRLGVATFDQLLNSDSRDHCDALGVYLPPSSGDLPRSALAWAVLTNEVLDPAHLSHVPPVWILGADPDTPQNDLLTHYLLASAFGVSRCYLPAEAISRELFLPRVGAPLSGARRSRSRCLGPPPERAGGIRPGPNRGP